MRRRTADPEPARAVERDFLRFRERGDTQAMARVFDAVAPRLLLVAAHVARDASEAEDLVQTTFLVALQEADGWDAERPLVPWMLGILSHRGLDQKRRQGVRRAEPLGEVQDVLDPAELAADAEQREAIATAVGNLPDPYREVLILRVAHGLEPVEIAHALGRSPEVVRVQLQRGRERLRRVLPESLGLPALLLVGVETDLAGVREAVLQEASTLALQLGTQAAAAAVPTSSALLGGLLTMKGIGITAGLLALSALSWTLWSGDGRTVTVATAEDRGAAAELAQPEDPLAARGPGLANTTALAERQVLEPRPAPRGLRVRARYERDGAPAADVGVYLRGQDSLGTEQRTDAEGRVRFDAVAAGTHRIDLDRWGLGALEVSLPRSEELELTLPSGLTVEGRVVDLDGAGVTGARVYRVSELHHDRLQLLATSAERGAFVLRDVAPGTELVARAAGFQPSSGGKASRGQTVRGGPGATANVTLELGARGNRVSGQVRLRSGAVVPHALVVFLVDEDARDRMEGAELRDRTDERGKAADLETFVVRADAAGAYTTDEVPGGSATVFARSAAEDELVGWTTIDVAPGRDYTADVVLEAGAEIYGRVTGEQGQPVEGIRVSCEWEGTAALGQAEDALGDLVADRATRTDEDGIYRLTGLLPGEYDLELEAAYGERDNRADAELLPGEGFEWNPIVEWRGELVVRVVDGADRGLAGWSLGLVRPGERLGMSELVPNGTNAAGRWRYENLRNTDYVLTVHPPIDLSAGDEEIPVPVYHALVRPSDQELLVRLDPLPTATLRGSVRRGSDAIASNRDRRRSRSIVTLRRSGEDTGGATDLDASGGFAFTTLSAGTYELLLHAPGGPREALLGTFDLQAGAALDVGELQAPAGGRLEVVLRTPSGAAIEPDGSDLSIALHAVEPRAGDPSPFRLRWNSAERLFRSEPALEGDYWLRVQGDAVPYQEYAVRLLEGQVASRTIRVDPGREVVFEVTFASEPRGVDVRRRVEPGEGKLDITIRGLNASPGITRRVQDELVEGEANRMRVSLHLEPGSYRVEIEDERYDGWEKPAIELDLVVEGGTEGDTAPQVVPVTLR